MSVRPMQTTTWEYRTSFYFNASNLLLFHCEKRLTYFGLSPWLHKQSLLKVPTLKCGCWSSETLSTQYNDLQQPTQKSQPLSVPHLKGIPTLSTEIKATANESQPWTEGQTFTSKRTAYLPFQMQNFADDFLLGQRRQQRITQNE